MTLNAGNVYEMVIHDVRIGESTLKGTPGLYMRLVAPEGELQHVEYVTAGRKEQIVKNLGAMGVPATELNARFWHDPALKLNGVKVSCTLDSESDGKGGTRLRVKWFNPLAKKASGTTYAKIADVFGFEDTADDPFAA